MKESNKLGHVSGVGVRAHTQEAVMRRLLLGLAVGTLLLSIGGCAPEFWNAMAQGMAAQGNAFAPGTGGPSSSERETVCAKYETEAGWSQSYSVQATIVKGSELNRRTGTFNYTPYSTYAVIFWAEGEASMLELEYYSGSLSAYGVDAVDQRGRKWHVARTNYCY